MIHVSLEGRSSLYEGAAPAQPADILHTIIDDSDEPGPVEEGHKPDSSKDTFTQLYFGSFNLCIPAAAPRHPTVREAARGPSCAGRATDMVDKSITRR